MLKILKDNPVKIKKCCICGKPLTGYGNNPWPVKKEGECCDDCNYEFVIPARIKGIVNRGE